MKTTFTLILLLLSYFSMAEDKQTVIDRIEAADSIPVYISRSKVSAQGYDPKKGGLALTSAEYQIKFVNTSFPEEIDSYSSKLIDSLNSHFNTDKFYFVKTGTYDEVKTEIEGLNLDFVVVFNHQALFQFEYESPRVSRESGSQVMISNRRLTAQVNVGFYAVTDKGELDDIKTEQGGATDEQSFQVKGYVLDANKLSTFRNPTEILEQLNTRTLEIIEEFSTKLKKKQLKIEQKRNKE